MNTDTLNTAFLKVDWAYAFDYLSILEVKAGRDIYNESKTNAFYECWNHIISQLGKAKTQEVLDSKEYDELLKANENGFDAVERARQDERFLAWQLDEINMKRYPIKKALQAKFFSAELIEQKT